MLKKTTALFLTFALTLLVSFEAITFSSGAPAGRSGSPASVGTCAGGGCHNGPSISTETITITTDIPASGFVENTDYNITITADDGGRNITRMGFEASVESAAGPEGSLSAPGNEVKTIGGGNFVTHTSAGISASGGSKSWTFTWNSGTAPDQTTVYTAVNFANSDGGTSGDAIGTEELMLSKDQAVDLAEAAVPEISVYPNPASDYIAVAGSANLEGDLMIYSLKGELIKRIASNELNNDIFVGNLKSGAYLITDQGGWVQHLRVL